MTEPLDLDAIESRAHLPADLPAAILTLARAVRERDADISRLSAEWLDKQRMLIAALEGLAERDAEIARLEEVYGDAYEKHYQEVSRLRTAPGADVMERARTLVHWWFDGGQGMDHPMVEDAARALQQYGDERAREAIREKDAEIARLRELFEATRRWGQHAPPGGDVLELARNTFRSLGVAVVTSEAVEAVASALQRYGDERAAAAREAAIEEAARWLAPNFPGQARDMVRALTAKPGSET